jgi:hypothetical protein
MQVRDRRSPRTEFESYVWRAATVLEAQGWHVVRRDVDPDAPWHLIARKAQKWRVLQVVSPATAPPQRQAARLELGHVARIPHRLGTMEQWLAHQRPDGHLSFGAYTLNAQRWATPDDTSSESLIALLGVS